MWFVTKPSWWEFCSETALHASHNITLAIVWSEEAADMIAEKHECSLSGSHNITLAIALACMVVGGLH